jgi:hypothetical protein
VFPQPRPGALEGSATDCTGARAGIERHESGDMPARAPIS